MGLIVLLAGGIGLAAARPAAAAAQPAPKPAVITVTGTDSAHGVQLTATVADAHRKPIAQATVSFFEKTTEFGPSGQLVPLGSAVTSKTGVARLTYQPAVTGAQRFVASYPGGPAAGQASASVGVLVTSAHSPYSPAPGKPFAAIGRALDGVLLTAVLLILITLAVQVERVRRVCRAGR